MCSEEIRIVLYEYKYVKLDIGGFFEKKPRVDYHVIIDNNASDGWKLVQIFAPPTAGYGTAPNFELIFERKKI